MMRSACLIACALLFAFALTRVSSQCSGTARSFTGGSGGAYLNASIGNWYRLTTEYTVEFWINPRSNVRWAGIIGDIYDSGTTESGFGFQQDGNLGLIFMHGTPFDYTFTCKTPIGSWTHVVGVLGGGTASLWVNGVKYASRPRDSASHTIPMPWLIGAFIDNDEDVRFNGELAEIRLWSVARSDSDIQNYWKTTVSVNSTGLVAYWPGRGSLTTVDDIVGGHHTFGSATTAFLSCDVCNGQWCVPTASSNPISRRPLPDIVLDADRLAASMQIIVRSFTNTSCAYLEGCVRGTGVRTLLRFDTATANIGTADLVLGDPRGNPLFVWDNCHGHYHYQYYARYNVYDANGVEHGVGRKQAYCLLDTERIAGGGPTNAVHTCNNQGISVGWQDVYEKTLDCQWIDVTDLPAGNYFLKISLNTPINGTGERLIQELNYDNNVNVIPFEIQSPCLPVPYFRVNTTTYSWYPYQGHTALTKSDDDAVHIQLPWSYTFYCTEYAGLWINPNGFISFESASGAYTSHPETYQNQQPWSNGISALWDDWDPTTAGMIYAGTSGNDKVVVTWAGVRRYGTPAGNEVTFQVVLQKDSQDVLINYQDTGTNNAAYNQGRSATIGVAGKLNTEFVQYSSRIRYVPVRSGTSLLFRSLAGTQTSPPTARAGGPYNGYVGMAVTLDGSSSSDPQGANLEFNWRAGDQAPPLSGEKPAHVYTEPGDYEVTLVVNNGFEDSTPVKTRVTIEDHPCCRACLLNP